MADAKATLIAAALLARIAAINGATGGYNFTPSEVGAKVKFIDDVVFEASKPAAHMWPNADLARAPAASKGTSSRKAVVLYRVRLYAAAGDFLNWAADVTKALEADPQDLGLTSGGDVYVSKVDVTGLRRVAAEEEVIGDGAQGDLEITAEYWTGRQEL